MTVFPNTTNTRTWPYGTVKAVEVLEVIAKPGAAVAAIICAETIISANERRAPEIFFLPLAPALVSTTHKGERGAITFRRGGPTLGFWEYRPNSELRIQNSEL